MSTLDITAAALLLKVHPKTLQTLARRGLVPSCKVGRAWVFVESLLLDYLRARSFARYVETPIQEDSACPSTSAKTRPFDGSSFRPSAASRSLYSKALGLPTSDKRSKSTTV